MRLTTKGRFAVTAMIDVALYGHRGPVTLAVWAVIYGLTSMKTVYGGRWSGVVARALFVAAGYSVFFAMAVVAVLLAAVALR